MKSSIFCLNILILEISSFQIILKKRRKKKMIKNITPKLKKKKIIYFSVSYLDFSFSKRTFISFFSISHFSISLFFFIFLFLFLIKSDQIEKRK